MQKIEVYEYKDLSEDIKDKVRETKEAAIKKAYQADEYIKENPKKSTLLGFVGGLVLGGLSVLLFRKKKKNDPENTRTN